MVPIAKIEFSDTNRKKYMIKFIAGERGMARAVLGLVTEALTVEM